jgi:hypothetical protein
MKLFGMTKALAASLALATLITAGAASAQVRPAPENNVRSCGSAYLEYDSSGVPAGPYCH